MSDFFSFYTFFEVTCFLLLVYSIKHIYQTKIAHELDKAVRREEEILQGLKDEQQFVKKQVQEVQEQTDQKIAYAKQLVEKIKAWNDVEKSRYKNLEQARDESQHRIKRYLEQQAEWLSFDQARKEAMPEALDGAQQELAVIFKDPEQQQAFLHELIKTIKKEGA